MKEIIERLDAIRTELRDMAETMVPEDGRMTHEEWKAYDTVVGLGSQVGWALARMRDEL